MRRLRWLRQSSERKSIMTELMILLLLAVLVGWAILHSVKKAKRGGGCCGEREETVKRVTVRDKNRSHYPCQVRMEIGGMTCENCARRVENALNSLDGVWAKVDIGSHKANVYCKAAPDKEKLARAVQEAGYVATAISETK